MKHPLVPTQVVEPYFITWEEIYKRVTNLENRLKNNYLPIYGIPRGGSIISGILNQKGHLVVDKPEDADIFIDDLIDSGATAKKYEEKYSKKVLALYDKRKEFQNTWLIFPWEREDEEDIEDSVRRILQYIGEDTNREGLKETPKRYIKFLKEFCTPPKFNFTVFDSEKMDEMIIQSNIPFHSLCEHHLLNFFGVGTIAYIPNGKIVGLSKLARSLEYFCRGLQNQERITTQVAEYLQKELKPEGVAVVLKARHSCMELRGVKKHDTWTTTSKMLGVFKDDLNCRNEFLNLVK